MLHLQEKQLGPPSPCRGAEQRRVLPDNQPSTTLHRYTRQRSKAQNARNKTFLPCGVARKENTNRCERTKANTGRLTRGTKARGGAAWGKDCRRTVVWHDAPIQRENGHRRRATGQYDLVGTPQVRVRHKQPWTARPTLPRPAGDHPQTPTLPRHSLPQQAPQSHACPPLPGHPS